jgi:hypothetical protein
MTCKLTVLFSFRNIGPMRYPITWGVPQSLLVPSSFFLLGTSPIRCEQCADAMSVLESLYSNIEPINEATSSGVFVLALVATCPLVAAYQYGYSNMEFIAHMLNSSCRLLNLIRKGK